METKYSYNTWLNSRMSILWEKKTTETFKNSIIYALKSFYVLFNSGDMSACPWGKALVWMIEMDRTVNSSTGVK